MVRFVNPKRIGRCQAALQPAHRRLDADHLHRGVGPQALTGREFGWSLRKGSIAWLTSRSASSNLVQLRATIGPDLLS